MSLPAPTIADYGLIGDMRTAALIGRHGGIDWCCLPRFDSGSVFAAILDRERGGTWEIQPVEPFRATQQYLAGTNVLVTAFQTESGEVTVTDFMPVTADGRPDGRHPEIHRQVTGVAGNVPLTIRFMPRFDYASRSTRLEVLRAGIFASDRTEQVLTLASAKPFEWAVAQGSAQARFQLEAGERRWMVLRFDDDDVHPVDRYESDQKLETTCAFWRAWSAKVRFDGVYRDAVVRSALALKLLTHAESGAIIAAPTTSLPETIGGSRNWDYRFVWLRDAVFTLDALEAVGHPAEAGEFMRFLRRVLRYESAGHLQIMYGLDGRRDLVERQLEHLSGYRGSRPVRVGNGAAGQLQIDVYGEVLIAADDWRKHHLLSEGTWRSLRPLVDWIAGHWELPDSSIWEVRGEVRHYVYSKVMSWAALDRGIRIAHEMGLDGDIAGWTEQRERVRAEILSRGWNPELNSFIQAFDYPDNLDAATLAIGTVGFLPWNDPRIVGTVRAVQRHLTTPDGELVYRYRTPDGLEGEEGAFSICTFWLAEALLRIGDRPAAEKIFRRMLGHANHLGLYSEEIDPATGEFLGNFPQGFTHLALIHCAVALTESD